MDLKLIDPDLSLAMRSESDLQAQLHELATSVGRAMATRNLMIRTAESCTGGAIARALTETGGSSAWFDCAYVTYSNDAKMRLLGIAPTILERHGAVSEPVARAMAVGALADNGGNNDGGIVTVSVTGVAGPGGGSADKPVGTVWFGWAGPSFQGERAWTATVKFDGDRSAVRLQTAIHALNQIQTFWL